MTGGIEGLLHLLCLCGREDFFFFLYQVILTLYYYSLFPLRFSIHDLYSHSVPLNTHHATSFLLL